MTEIIIHLNIDDVPTFVSHTRIFSFDLDIRPVNNSRVLIDAKSLMGILTLDLSKPLILIAHTNHDHELRDLEQCLSMYIDEERK